MEHKKKNPLDLFPNTRFVDFENRIRKGHDLLDLFIGVIFESSIILLICLKVFYVVYSEGLCAK